MGETRVHGLELGLFGLSGSPALRRAMASDGLARRLGPMAGERRLMSLLSPVLLPELYQSRGMIMAKSQPKYFANLQIQMYKT